MNISEARKNILYCFKNIAGWRIELVDVDLSVYQLPQFYNAMYGFLLARKDNHEFIVVIVKGQESVIDIAKRRDYFTTVFKKPVAFYFDEISHRTRQRLIQRKINFICSNKYLFVPFMGILETSTFEEVRGAIVLITFLGLMGQRLVLAYLNGLIKNGDSGKDISQKLGFSAMTISKGLKELEMLECFDLIPNGAAKNAKFPERKELWEVVEDKLETPVIGVVYLADPPKQCLVAGLTALSKRTMLVDPGLTTYAIHREEYEKKKNSLEFLPEGEGLKIEIWKWDPALFSQRETVDPFSLALSLRGEKDERVLIAIDEMLKEALK